MKPILVIIVFLFCYNFAFSSECEEFHAQEVKPLFIDGLVKSKKTENDYYVIEVENNDKKIVVLKLWKNNTTKELVAFIRRTTRIIKQKDSIYTKVIEILPDNGGFEVRHFKTLCD